MQNDKQKNYSIYEDEEGNSHIQIAQWDFEEKADAELVPINQEALMP